MRFDFHFWTMSTTFSSPGCGGTLRLVPSTLVPSVAPKPMFKRSRLITHDCLSCSPAPRQRPLRTDPPPSCEHEDIPSPLSSHRKSFWPVLSSCRIAKPESGLTPLYVCMSVRDEPANWKLKVSIDSDRRFPPGKRTIGRLSTGTQVGQEA